MRLLRRQYLNFGKRQWQLQPLGLAVCIAGVAASIYGVLDICDAYRTRDHEQALREAASQQIRQIKSRNARTAKLSVSERLRYGNAMAIESQLGAPWADLLKLLETSPMEHVALLSIEPLASNRQLRLVAEAQDISAMLTYLAYLQQQPALHQVVLDSHLVQRQMPGKPVRFQIQAKWGAE